MTRDDAFLADIGERPDDDAPRLIYADWLDDHGEPERADFIRVQVELGRLPLDEEGRMGRRGPRRDARWARLQSRSDRLERRHGAAWRARLPELPGVVWSGRFERGFVAEVTVEAVEALERHADAVFRAAPVTAVRVGRPASAFDVAAAPSLARVRALAVTFDELHSGGVAALSGSPHLAGLESLDLGALEENGLLTGTRPLALPSLREVTARADLTTTAAVPTLCSLPFLRSLTALDLSPSGVRDCGAEVLALCSHLVNLRALDLSGNGIGTRGLRALTRSSFLQGLRYLGLGLNEIQPEWGELLAASPFLTGLRGLVLTGDESAERALEAEGLISLLEAPLTASLVLLDIGENALGMSGAEVLASTGALSAMRTLGLNYNRFGPAGVEALASAPHLSALESLSLGGNRLGSEGVRRIAEACLPAVHEVDLHFNDIGAGGVGKLAEAAFLPRLTSLVLRGNPTGDATARLASTAACASIYHLEIGRLLGRRGAKALLRAPDSHCLSRLVAPSALCEDDLLRDLAARFDLVTTDTMTQRSSF